MATFMGSWRSSDSDSLGRLCAPLVRKRPRMTCQSRFLRRVRTRQDRRCPRFHHYKEVRHEKKIEKKDVQRAAAELSSEFARRVGGLADLFENWRKLDVARSVIDSLIAGDAEAFGKLSRSLAWEPGGSVRPLDACIFLRGVVEKIVESRSEKVRRLPPTLSSQQKAELFLIVRQANQNGWPMQFGPEALIADQGRQVIGGPDFLNALVGAGLVSCGLETVADVSGLSLVFGPPRRVCV
jgi:hypothetical protein